MTKRQTEAERIREGVMMMARTSFKDHQIRECTTRRVLIQRRDSTGKWQWPYAAEIILLYGGKLLVHGDIAHALFASTDAENILAALDWLSEGHGSSYVEEKAIIGMGVRKSARKFFDPIRLTYATEAILTARRLIPIAPWGMLPGDTTDSNYGRICLRCKAPVRAGMRPDHEGCRPVVTVPAEAG